MAASSFLDAFQKVADIATSSRGMCSLNFFRLKKSFLKGCIRPVFEFVTTNQ